MMNRFSIAGRRYTLLFAKHPVRFRSNAAARTVPELIVETEIPVAPSKVHSFFRIGEQFDVENAPQDSIPSDLIAIPNFGHQSNTMTSFASLLGEMTEKIKGLEAGMLNAYQHIAELKAGKVKSDQRIVELEARNVKLEAGKVNSDQRIAELEADNLTVKDELKNLRLEAGPAMRYASITLARQIVVEHSLSLIITYFKDSGYFCRKASKLHYFGQLTKEAADLRRVPADKISQDEVDFLNCFDKLSSDLGGLLDDKKILAVLKKGRDNIHQPPLKDSASIERAIHQHFELESLSGDQNNLLKKLVLDLNSKFIQ
jgi:hypothetical protein